MLRLLAFAALALAHAQNASRIEYNVLIVGDVHDDLAAIDELRSRLGRQSRKYHLLLCTGDLTTMPHGNVEGSAKPEATPHTNAFVSKASEAARAQAIEAGRPDAGDARAGGGRRGGSAHAASGAGAGAATARRRRLRE